MSKDPEFLNYMNTWLTLKKNDGFKEEQYKLWIMGQTSVAAPAEPRWSILDNVLQWGKKSKSQKTD